MRNLILLSGKIILSISNPSRVKKMRVIYGIIIFCWQLALLGYFFYTVYKPSKKEESLQAPSPKKDDLNDVVITYSVKVTTPTEFTSGGHIKTDNNGASAHNQKETSTTESDTSGKRTGLENPNFVSDS